MEGAEADSDVEKLCDIADHNMIQLSLTWLNTTTNSKRPIETRGFKGIKNKNPEDK